MEYFRLTKGLADKGKLIPNEENIYSLIKDDGKDYYRSVFLYNEKHKEQFAKTGSVSGITDVTTDLLYFDFDSATNIDQARRDAVELCTRLTNGGISDQDIQIFFSGKKGFSVVLQTNKRFTVEDWKNINQELAGDLATNDKQILNASRIMRVPGTKHQDTKLYKYPLTLDQLRNLEITEIKHLAKSLENVKEDFVWNTIDLPEHIYSLRVKKLEAKTSADLEADVTNLDFKRKPAGFSNCKFAIMNGFFPPGMRHNSLMALAATCRNQGYPKETTYSMLKAAARLQGKRFNTDPVDKEEIWKNIITSTYSPTWNGAQYSCKNQPWLKEICDTLGPNKCKHTDELTVHTEDVHNMFVNYAVNYEKNILTTGIRPVDDRIKFMVGTSNGILAPPGVGKSSLAFEMLHHNSKLGINSIFFSYDMYHSMVYLRLIQKHFGLQSDEIFKTVKHDKSKLKFWQDTLTQEYKNVNFCFKSGQTPEEIIETIDSTEQLTGQKVKLVVIDYNELVIADVSDPTQASAKVAQRLRQIANDKEVCVVTLLQPAKIFSNPADEIATYQGAKGSGAIAQSLTLMLSLSRPGFSPRNPEEDKFFTINALKNRNGPLFTVDLSWEGLTGKIRELAYEEEEELKMIRQRKSEEKKQSGEW